MFPAPAMRGFVASVEEPRASRWRRLPAPTRFAVLGRDQHLLSAGCGNGWQSLMDG
jgi:hypothetical protein